MIQIDHLTKRFGRRTAVSDVSLVAVPGRVTALLGPNGAGKSTTLRALLGLTTPDEGAALIDGRPYRSLRMPLRTVGAQLDGSGAHRARTAAAHLAWIALANGIPRSRVPVVLDLVGLGDVGDRRVGTYSLGMGQRLGIAAALLGDPSILVLDEPTNGLDAEGIRWIRALIRSCADEGRTVLVSSHLMHEVQTIADRIVVIDDGRVIRAGDTDDLLTDHADLEHAYFSWLGRSDERLLP